MEATIGSSAAGTAAELARALELACRYLSRRERTVFELRRYLIGCDLGPSAVEAAIAELAATGYLDDARFARMFTQDKRELQQWGSARIRTALLGRGVDRDVVEAALAEPSGGDVYGTCHGTLGAGAQDAGSPGGELERAIALLKGRFPDPPHERRDRQRALGVLLRRGYEAELAVSAIAAYCQQEI